MSPDDIWNLEQSLIHGQRVRYWLATGLGPVPGSLEWRAQYGWKPILTEV